MRRDHLLFDLLPMFQSLDLLAHTGELGGPIEEVGGGHALSIELDGWSDGCAIFFLKLCDQAALPVEIHRITVEWKIRQPDDTGLFCLLYTSPSPRDRQKSR